MKKDLLKEIMDEKIKKKEPLIYVDKDRNCFMGTSDEIISCFGVLYIKLREDVIGLNDMSKILGFLEGRMSKGKK